MCPFGKCDKFSSRTYQAFQMVKCKLKIEEKIIQKNNVVEIFCSLCPIYPSVGLSFKNFDFSLGFHKLQLFPNFQPTMWSRYMKFQCTSCAEISDHWQYVSLSEEQPKSWQDPKQKRTSTPPRGHVNHTVKCKLCSKSNNLTIMEGSIRPYR